MDIFRIEIVIPVIVIIAYVVCMKFWPELVGITGKKAIKNQESHRKENTDYPEKKP